MEKIVYILGAGFSAPRGLPIMSDFLSRARDMMRDYDQEYNHFDEILNKINEINGIKNYFKADLFNIEEVLSILEMKSDLGGEDYAKLFRELIKEVVNYYTPKIPKLEKFPGSNWYHYIFGPDDLWNRYGCFMANLRNLAIYKTDNDFFDLLGKKNISTSYSVLTLNYDLILENTYNFIKSQYGEISNQRPVGFDLIKLHGSADSDVIIAPTFNKSTIRDVKEIWKTARKRLQESNQIRIIGYSLPNSDNHVRYLLKSSILNTDNLKKIDVICRDQKNKVGDRYNEFFDGSCYDFIRGNVEDYLNEVFQIQMNQFERTKKISRKDTMIYYDFNSLEEAHKRFKSKYT